MRTLLTLVMFLVWSPSAAEQTFHLGERSYHVKTPAGWNGVAELPVLFHFHGWGRNGAQVIRNKRIYQATGQHGMLLVAPSARGRSFDFWQPGSDDVDFTDAIVEDIAKRFPIDRNRIFISGFSWGAAMVWRLACERGDHFHTYLPIAGHLYNQEHEHCAAGPVNIVHVHGLKDTVVDPVPGTAQQPWRAVELWFALNRCDVSRENSWRTDQFNCAEWSCQTDKLTRVCLHQRGHFIPKGWLELTLGELLDR